MMKEILQKINAAHIEFYLENVGSGCIGLDIDDVLMIVEKGEDAFLARLYNTTEREVRAYRDIVVSMAQEGRPSDFWRCVALTTKGKRCRGYVPGFPSEIEEYLRRPDPLLCTYHQKNGAKRGVRKWD